MWKSPLSAKFSAISRPYFHLPLPGFARVVSDVRDTWWREFERSNHWSSKLGVWRASDNGTLWKPTCWECSTIVEEAKTHEGCSADWRRRRMTDCRERERERERERTMWHKQTFWILFRKPYQLFMFNGQETHFKRTYLHFYWHVSVLQRMCKWLPMW